MTIAERKAREAHDRDNPWRAMDKLPPIGLLVNLLFYDMAGHHSADGTNYFRDTDDRWYYADDGRDLYDRPMNWRPAWIVLRPERLAILRTKRHRPWKK